MAKCPPVPVKELFQLWHNGTKIADICEQLKISESRLRSLTQKYGLPKRQGGNTKRNYGKDPTPEELARLTAETRQKWSQEEKEARYVGPKKRRWTVPAYHFDGRTNSFTTD
jgi:hypothetical protein